jgi:uncharacterized protein (TIGR02246 family)
MATADMKHVLDEWARAWSSHDTERVLTLFTEDCIYEDVTFGMVNRGKQALRAFADGVFASVSDFTSEVTARFAAGTWAGMEWVISGTGTMKKGKMTIETLAAASQERFLALEKNIDAGFGDVRGDVKLILPAIENVSGQIADVKQCMPSAPDFPRLEGHVDVIEKTLGLTSKGS